jgi:hypothetical protein
MAHCARLCALLATCVLVTVQAAPYFLSKNGEIASLTPTKWSGTSTAQIALETVRRCIQSVSGFKCHNANDLRCEDRVCRMFPNGKECCLCQELLDEALNNGR